MIWVNFGEKKLHLLRQKESGASALKWYLFSVNLR
jgi:hypothetical protein